MNNERIVEAARGVFLVRGTDVNWVLVREGDGITVIDAGYPGDAGAVEQSVRDVGARPEDVRAILLTHAHIDHMGAANHFHERYGTPLYCDAAEVAHAHRDYLEQAGPVDVIRNLHRPGVLPWSLRIARAGAMKRVSLPHAKTFPTDGALDLPGGPVPVPTHGHTSGHSAYHLPAAGAVVTGDALVTGHAISRADGPQLIDPMFQHDAAAARAALDALAALDADIVLPGHGRAVHLPIAGAVTRARERVERAA